MKTLSLEETAAALVSDSKGILAADESFPTIEKRFKKLKIPSTAETRRFYREMLFTAPDLGRYISGVILFDETIRQTSRDGRPLPEILAEGGMIPGIKVDQGTTELPGFPGEKITEGLDRLAGRLEEYARLGARFAKWRAVITIDAGRPTRTCIEANAHALARYAALCQQGGLVPIVEPEVLMDGSHSLDRCFEVTEEVQHAVFAELVRQRVGLERMLLKPSMVLAGEDAGTPSPPEKVADATVRCLRRTVPSAVPGILFLSGGQSDQTATLHLNLMNRGRSHPWPLSFSYGRALQDAAMQTWAGDSKRAALAQKALLHRARCNSAARTGSYNEAMESAKKR